MHQEPNQIISKISVCSAISAFTLPVLFAQLAFHFLPHHGHGLESLIVKLVLLLSLITGALGRMDSIRMAGLLASASATLLFTAMVVLKTA